MTSPYTLTDWIEHDGAPLPKHANLKDRVVLRFRDGEEQGLYFPMTVEWWSDTEYEDNNWEWESTSPDNEIIAYRVVTK